VTGERQEIVAEVERVDAGAVLELERDTVAVCIPVFEAHGELAQCLHSVLLHTSTEVPILVADDAGNDAKIGRFLAELAESGALHHRLLYMRHTENVGFVENVNAALATLAPADVVVLNSDCIVGPEWLERLRAAACSDSTIATATALTNHGTILSIPERNSPQSGLPDHLDIDGAARLVAAGSHQLRPRIPTAVGHCMYLRRHALELVGDFDVAFSPGYGEEVDYSQRCLAQGFVHVAADDVFVYHRGGGSFKESIELQENHEAIVRARHPFYQDAVRVVSESATGALPRAIASAAIAMRPVSVTLDARFLGRTITGTQLQALELIHALSRTKRADLRIVLPSNVGEWAQATLAEMDGVEILRGGEARDSVRTDIYHRPSQLFSWPELRLIPELGDRLVLTHLDLISYRNPTYHASFTDWREYQRLTRLALALADSVVTMSEHARDDLLSEQLVDPSRLQVVQLGVNHHLPGQVEPRRPRRLSEAAQERFFLCIGTNFRHKNRLFALRILEALQQRHGWDGWLVFAGPHARHGSSAGDEAEFLALRPRIASRVVDLRAVGEDEKLWLLGHATGVLYPSTYEGFGLVPFEAADHGTPCFFAWQTAIQDVLPRSAATLVPWAADESADRILGVLKDESLRLSLVATIRATAQKLTWNHAAERMLDVYDETVRREHRDVPSLASEHVPTSLKKLTSIRNPEVLDIEPELYRALHAFTTHPIVTRPFVRGVKWLYRVGYTLKHGRPPRPLRGDR
jgi:glycosyltransferase involved in cell wall biosynthesis